MLNVCANYAKDHSITFNAKKSCVFVSDKCKLPRVQVRPNDEELNVVEQANHLGHLLNCDVDNVFDIGHVISCFTKSVNILLAEF